MAARPQGWPSERRAVITTTPEASDAIASWNSCSGLTSTPPSAPRRRRPPRRGARRARDRPRGSRCAGGRRGSPRARGTTPRPAARPGTGRPPARAGRPRTGAGPRGATAPRGWRPTGGEGSGASPLGVRLGGPRLVPRRRRGAPAEHEALRQRVRRQPVRAVQAGAGTLADRVEPGHGGAAVEVGGHAAHRVVRGRRDGDRLASPGRSPPRRARRRCWGSAPMSTERMSSWTEAAPPALQLALDRQRHLVARRQLVHEPLAVGVEQGGALAAHGLGDEEPVAGPVAHQRGGVELRELEVGEVGARRVRERQSHAHRAGRVGRAPP